MVKVKTDKQKDIQRDRTITICPCTFVFGHNLSSLKSLMMNVPREDPGVKSRMCPLYPQRIVKGD